MMTVREILLTEMGSMTDQQKRRFRRVLRDKLPGMVQECANVAKKPAETAPVEKRYENV